LYVIIVAVQGGKLRICSKSEVGSPGGNLELGIRNWEVRNRRWSNLKRKSLEDFSLKADILN